MGCNVQCACTAHRFDAHYILDEQCSLSHHETIFATFRYFAIAKYLHSRPIKLIVKMSSAIDFVSTLIERYCRRTNQMPSIFDLVSIQSIHVTFKSHPIGRSLEQHSSIKRIHAIDELISFAKLISTREMETKWPNGKDASAAVAFCDARI